MNVVSSEFVGAISQLALFSIIPFVWWLIAGRKEDNFFKWIGIKKGKCLSPRLKILLLTIIVIGIYVGLTSLCIRFLADGITTAGRQFEGKGIVAIPAAIIYAFIRTGLAEEILFRGFILKRVSAKFGFKVGNAVQAVLFGLMHGIPFGIVTGNIVVTVFLTILPGAFGWFEGWLNEKQFEGSIIPSWLIHGTMNLVTTLLSL